MDYVLILWVLSHVAHICMYVPYACFQLQDWNTSLMSVGVAPRVSIPLLGHWGHSQNHGRWWKDHWPCPSEPWRKLLPPGRSKRACSTFSATVAVGCFGSSRTVLWMPQLAWCPQSIWETLCVAGDALQYVVWVLAQSKGYHCSLFHLHFQSQREQGQSRWSSHMGPHRQWTKLR